MDVNGTVGGAVPNNDARVQPRPTCSFDCEEQNTDPVMDESVIASFIGGIALGIFSFIAFSCLWKCVKVYTSRQHLRQVTYKPPDVQESACCGWQRYWGWLVPVFMTRTDDIYVAAGLDAVVLLKTIEFGVQLFTPMAVLCLVILVPVHLRGGALPEVNAQTFVPFKQITIANLRPHPELEGMSIYWLHLGLAYVFVLYALWLMNYHYKDIAHMRRRSFVHGEGRKSYLFKGVGEASRGAPACLYDDTAPPAFEGRDSTPAFTLGSNASDGVPPVRVAQEPLQRSSAGDDATGSAAAARAPWPVRMLRPLPSPRPGPASVSATQALQHSHAGDVPGSPQLYAYTQAGSATGESRSDGTRHAQDMGVSRVDSLAHPGKATDGHRMDGFNPTSPQADSTQPLVPSMHASGSERTEGTAPARVNSEAANKSEPPLPSVAPTKPTAALVVDDPADVTGSVAVGSHRGTLRSGQGDEGAAIGVSAVGRAVVDADGKAGRVATGADVSLQTAEGTPWQSGARKHDSLRSRGPPQPLKWWVSRAEDGAEVATWLAASTREPHTSMWRDSEAVLSRKPSVRFQRTIDLMMPVLDDEGAVIGERKTALDVHKYCVLVTDVPVDEALAQARNEAVAVAEQDESQRSPDRSTRSHSAPSMHAESSKQHHQREHLGRTVTSHLSAHNHTVPIAQRAESPAGAPNPPASDRGGSATARCEGKGNLWSALPAPVAEGTCAAAGGGHAALPVDDWVGRESDGSASGSPGAFGGERGWWPPALSREAGGTDLRHQHARERLAMSLLASELDTANAIEGEVAAAAWRKVMAGATVPEPLQQELCQWLERRRREEAAAMPGESGSEAGAGSEANLEERCRAARCRAAGAVAEGQERRASAQSNGDGRAVEVGRRASHAMSTHGGQVAFIEAEEADRAKHIATAAAAAVSGIGIGINADEDLPSYGNAAREAVTKHVATAFDTIFSEAKPRLIPVLNHQKVHQQLLKWDRLHRALEKVEAQERARHMSSQQGGPAFRPVMRRTGLFGLFGKLAPSREFLQDKISECEWSIDREREAVFANGISRAYFVVFETQMAATIAAQALLHSADARLYKCKAAPGPDNVNWSALWCSNRERVIRRILGGLMFFAVMCIPLGGFAGALSELNSISCDSTANGAAPTPAEVADAGRAVDTAAMEEQEVWFSGASCAVNQLTRVTVTELLPAVLIIIWQNVMPLTLYSIALYEKAHTSFDRLDRRIVMLFFWWDLFNVFFGAIVGGGITNVVQEFITSSDATVVLGSSLWESSNFFINYLALRAFGLVPFRLIVVHSGIWRWLLMCGGRCGCVLTARDSASFLGSRSIRYGRELGLMMLVFITAWAYAVVSPLVVVVSALFFMSSWIVWRWQIVYVYVRCYEGDGSLWRSFVTCIMRCLYLFIIFTACVFVAKRAYYQAALLFLPLVVGLSIFWKSVTAKYDPAIKYVPLEVSVGSVRVHIDEMTYVAAPLRPRCSGWHPEWGKAWEACGAPAFTA